MFKTDSFELIQTLPFVLSEYYSIEHSTGSLENHTKYFNTPPPGHQNPRIF